MGESTLGSPSVFWTERGGAAFAGPDLSGLSGEELQEFREELMQYRSVLIAAPLPTAHFRPRLHRPTGPWLAKVREEPAELRVADAEEGS